MDKRKILIGGASGFVGNALVNHFKKRGWKVVKLSRTHKSGQIFWDIENAYLNPYSISDFDAVISLAGENIFTRWTKKKKFKIISSRVNSAEAISRAIALSKNPPKVFLCASAIGYYGNNNKKEIDENSPKGKGFLAEVCKHWEFASQCAKTPNTRIVNMRFGVVLDDKGGFFHSIKNFMRFGLRLLLGDGTTNFSWISLSDLCRAIDFAIENESISGAVNFTSTKPCTYRDFTDACVEMSQHSIMLKIPRWIIRLCLGEIANEMIFANTKVLPKKLLNSGFHFYDNDIFSFIKKRKAYEKYPHQNYSSTTCNHDIKCLLKRK